MIFTKTVEEKDYSMIDLEVQSLKATQKALTERGVRIDIGHPHRLWEYGMALHTYHTWLIKHSKSDDNKILDVGSGLGLLGPTISWSCKVGITEIEPNLECEYDRRMCNAILMDMKYPKINWLNESLSQSKESYFDVVFCISVIEHVIDDHSFLRKLADKVKQDGLLFLTTDVMPTMPGIYHFDNLRERNYVMFDILNKVRYLESVGFESFGESDFAYKGNQVFDYSFASICMRKK